ncbi:hypothetical protein HPB48_001832 [Haemaphysalis longicornis]|uniref:Major facilitator superfamily (MFS) profile domain-containing protein n=1 Tax=Haemaphysalis longicornis TaxID=44386 RepID=A0A9J6G4E3_HAELO|nr:hypothetical protein HPB48_001832 [Haemaphysalis longicornis]
MDFNDALSGAGDFGTYQKLLILLLVVPSGALCALVYFTQYFIILIPEDYSCRLDEPPRELLDAYNLTSDLLRQLALPPDEESGSGLSRCLMYDTNLTSLVMTGNLTSNATWDTVACRNGWDYKYGNLYPTIATELNMVCDRSHLSYYVQTFFYAGTSIGSVFFGFIADRYGRKPSIVVSYAMAWLAGLASSFVHNLAGFAILRFLVGMCIIPLSEDPYVLSLEYIGPRWRTLPIVLWALSYIIFSMLCPWLAYGIHNWTYLSVCTSMPLLLVVVFMRFVPESASWLLTRGRNEAAVRYLQQVAFFNKRHIPENLELKAERGTREESKRVTFLDLFRTPRIRKHSLLMLCAWFVTYCCYHTNVYNTSFLGTDVYLSYTLGSLVELPGMLLVLFGLDTLGRRWPMIIVTGVAGVVGIFSILFRNGPYVSGKHKRETSADISAFKARPVSVLVLSLLMRVCLTAEYDTIMQYSAEVYPTVLRGRGLAFLRFAGTLSLYVSPSIVYLASRS